MRGPQRREPANAPLRNFLLARRAYRLDLNAMPRIVVIVGRPNVGKSRLFNRLARKRISIVHDQAGVTRDVISTHIADGGYTLLDTGGVGFEGGDTPPPVFAGWGGQGGVSLGTGAPGIFLVPAPCRG